MNERIAQALDMLAQTTQAFTAELASLRTLLEELRQAHASMAKVLEASAANRSTPTDLEMRVEELARTSEELRKENELLRAQSERFSAQMTRKTVPPQVLTLLAKSGVAADVVGPSGRIEVLVLDKALEGLPVEQRIAVKSQLARAGVLE